LLATRGGKVDSADEYGVTPLMQAARGGRTDVARALIDAGARPELKTRSGRSALDLAREAAQPELVKLLESPRR
jgi:ankyrin repeat protein